MEKIDWAAVDAAARREVRQEEFRKAVEARKEVLRTAKKPFWHRVIPFIFNIIIRRP